MLLAFYYPPISLVKKPCCHSDSSCKYLYLILVNYAVILRFSRHSLQSQSGQSLHSVQELPQCCSQPQSSQINLIRLSISSKPFKALVAITHTTVSTVLALFVAVWIAVASMTFFSHLKILEFFVYVGVG